MLTAEDKIINLNALKNQDPFATKILDTALRVAVYKFLSKKNEWKKLDVEGSLFVFERMVEPLHSFVVMNTLALHLFLQPITCDLEFQDRNPFLLYKTPNDIYGIWFIDGEDCARVKKLMISLTEKATERKQERDKGKTATIKTSSNVSESLNSDSLHLKLLNMSAQANTVQKVVNGSADTNNSTNGVDIIQMLAKAQNQYNKSINENGAESQQQQQQPQPKQIGHWPVDFNVNSNTCIKPEPIRLTATTATTTTTTTTATTSNVSPAASKPESQPQHINPIIQRLLSMPTDSSQHEPTVVNGTATNEQLSLELKRKLNILNGSHTDVKPPIHLTSSSLITTNGAKNLITLKDFEENMINESSKNMQQQKLENGNNKPLFYLENSFNQLQQTTRPNQLALSEFSESVTPLSSSNANDRRHTYTKQFSSNSESSHDGVVLHSPASVQFPLLLTPAAFETSTQMPTNTNSSLSYTQPISSASSTTAPTTQPSVTTTGSFNFDLFKIDNTLTDTSASLIPLNKAQLQNVLINLLKTDDKFLTTIHDSYLQSVNK